MEIREFLDRTMDAGGGTVNQPRKMGTTLLYREVKFFQTFFFRQICATQGDGQTLLGGDRTEVFGSLFIANIVRYHKGTSPRKTERYSVANSASATGNQKRFTRQRKQFIPA